ncbi:MAG: PilZ domain-containing protein [Acidithiobacillus ferrivorans]
MSLTKEINNLTMILPIRGEYSLSDYFALLQADQSAVNVPLDLCNCLEEGSLMTVFPENPQGHVCAFHFRGIESGRVLLTPKFQVDVADYDRALVFAEKDGVVCLFLARLEYVADGVFHYTPAPELFQRKVRAHKRLPMCGHVTVRKKDARTFACDIVDFSPAGISFKSRHNDFVIGELLLLEMEIADCGLCETTGTISHWEKCGLSNAIYGAQLRLTKEEAKKVEHLYLCKEGERIQNLSKNSASRLHDLRWRD